MKSDTYLKKDLLAELSWDPLVPETRVEIAVKDGVVTFTGQVDNFPQRAAIEHAARRVCGVKAIALELDVSPPIGLHTCGEPDAAPASVLNLNRTPPAAKDSSKSLAATRWVALKDEIERNFLRLVVAHSPHPRSGVTEPTGKTMPEFLVISTKISNRIQDALARQAMRKAKHIQIEVDGDYVTLRGSVHSWEERCAVEGAACSVPGISQVNNQLNIDGWYAPTSRA